MLIMYTNPDGFKFDGMTAFSALGSRFNGEAALAAAVNHTIAVDCAIIFVVDAADGDRQGGHVLLRSDGTNTKGRGGFLL